MAYLDCSLFTDINVLFNSIQLRPPQPQLTGIQPPGDDKKVTGWNTMQFNRETLQLLSATRPWSSYWSVHIISNTLIP